MSNKPANATTEKIGVGEKLAYGCGDLASNLVLVLTSTYVTFFYTEALHLNIAIIGMIVMVSRLFDGFSDFFMGYIMDKTHSKHGKARAWMYWLAIPFGLCTALMFFVPELGDTGKYIYVFLSYNIVTTILYTAINIPYGALNSLMTRDQTERASVNVWRMTMAQVGGLVINAFTLPLVNGMGGSSTPGAWRIVACLYGAAASILFLVCFYGTKERVHATSEADQKIGLGKTLKVMFKNDQWLLLCGVWIVTALGLGVSMSAGAYYAKYLLGNENLVGFLAVTSQIVTIICMPFMMTFVKKFGKCKVALVGTFVAIVAHLLVLINPLSFSWLLFCNVVIGLSSAPSMATLFAMIADTIEYGQWKTGTRVEGTLYSSTTFGAKVGAGIGMAIATSIMGAAGYVEGAVTQSASALGAIHALYVYVPIVFSLIMPIFYILYKLDKIYPQVMKDLADREGK